MPADQPAAAPSTAQDTPEHHWDFVDEEGCLHCNCGYGVVAPTPGSKPAPPQPPIALYRELRAQVATLQRELAEAKEDVQRGYDWQRGYSERLVEAQTKIEVQAHELEAAQDEVRTLKLLNDTVEQDLMGSQSRLADAERRLGAAKAALEEVRAAANDGADCTPLWHIAKQALDALAQGEAANDKRAYDDQNR